jgi:hypothetical protein
MKYFLNIILGFLFFILSFFLLEIYIGGDQVHYINYYKDVKGDGFLAAYSKAYFYISATEPLSLFFLWLGSNLNIDKNFYISLFNTTLFFLLLSVINKFKFKLITTIFILSNFYFFVLYTGAERLKFLFIPLLLSILVKKSIHKKILIFSLPFFHLQGIIFLLFEILRNAKNISISKNFFYLFFLFLLLLLFFPYISNKFYAYLIIDQFIFMEIIQVSILSTLLFIISRDIKMVLLFFLYFSTASLFLGNSRINMIAFFVYANLLIKIKKFDHPLNLVLLFYFSCKTFYLINNIIAFGDGFVSDE